ncbi:MBL fold metallo-hydrolase [Catenulispora yoronensis]
MPWELEIKVLDVGQGDSTVIVAREMGLPPGMPTRSRTMLVDGGRSFYASLIHDALINVNLPLNHIVCTHYDADHVGGLQALLLADDMSNVAWALGSAGVANLGPAGLSRPEVVAAVTAAVDSAARGNTGLTAGVANTAAANARNNTAATDGIAAAVDEGVYWAELPATPYPALVASQAIRRKVAEAAGLAAGLGVSLGEAVVLIQSRIRRAVFDGLRNRVYMTHGRFFTANRYNNVHIIDLGDVGAPGVQTSPNSWTGAITGNITLTNGARTASVARTRTSIPVLCSEVLWNSGPNAILAPAGAPRVYVVARSGRDWPAAPTGCRRRTPPTATTAPSACSSGSGTSPTAPSGTWRRSARTR